MKPFRLALCLLPLLLLLLLAACDNSSPPAAPAKPAPAATASEKSPASAPAPTAANPATETAKKAQTPPAPPVAESFDAKPQLSIFPRIGQYRPEAADKEQFGVWQAYIDHLIRTSAVQPKTKGDSKDRVLTFRSIKGAQSVGFFAPLEVKPDTAYRVRFAFKGKLAKGASAGIGLQEFSEFRWVGEQYTEKENQDYLLGTQQGAQAKSSDQWQEYHFSFRTGARTRMIHLIIYLDGANGRTPVSFDQIRITPG